MTEISSRPAPIRSIKAFEQESARTAADFQWAEDAALRIREWLPTASVGDETRWTVRIDVPTEVVDGDGHEYSRRGRTLVALLAYAGWSSAEIKGGRVSLYAARHAVEVVTDDGERFSPMYNTPDLGRDIGISLSKGATRACADGTTEWIPEHRIRHVRYLNTVDVRPLNLLEVANATVFELTLHRTYFDQGFFNVTLDYDQYVRAREGPVRLRLGPDGIEIEGKISRQANINNTARIYGGTPLRDWFQKNCIVMDTVAVDLSSQDVIILDQDGRQLNRLRSAATAISVALSPLDSNMIPFASDLDDKRLTVAAEFRDHNPRRPCTHGWVAFEVLRRAPGGSLRFQDYARRLFEPDDEIRALARTIPGERDAYQHFKHIRCDIYRKAVRVSPSLPDEWYTVRRCSPGTQPSRG